MTTVTVYSTGPACQRCRLTYRCLTDAGIPFVEVDLADEANAPAREYVTGDLGYTEAPVVVVDDEPQNHWSGFRPDLIARLADQTRRHDPSTGAGCLPIGSESQMTGPAR